MTSAATDGKVRVAVVQAGSVPFDSSAYVDKAIRLTADAAADGAKLVLFPEAFIVGYPKGLNYGLVVGARDPVGREELRLYLDAAIEVPGPHTQRLGEAAATYRVYLVIGVRRSSPFIRIPSDDDKTRLARWVSVAPSRAQPRACAPMSLMP